MGDRCFTAFDDLIENHMKIWDSRMNKLIVSLIGLSFFFAQDVCGEWALDAAPKFGNGRARSLWAA